MSNTKKICSVLIAAEGPLTAAEVAKKAGVELNQATSTLWAFTHNGIVKKTGERGAFEYSVANVDAVKKRAAGEMKGGRKPKEAAPDKPAKVKRRKPVKTKPTKRRATKRAVKRLTRAQAANPGRDHCFYRGDDGELQIHRLSDQQMITLDASEVARLARFIVATPPAVDPKRGRKGARR